MRIVDPFTGSARDRNAARVEAGYPNAWLYNMRHTGLTVRAYAGLTMKELMARAGHST